MKKICCAWMLLAVCVSAMAAPRNASNAVAVINGWLAGGRHPLNETVGNRVKNVETLKDGNGSNLCHIVYLSPSGFVVVAADDLLEPVIAFSSGKTFDFSPKNALFSMINKDLPKRMNAVRKAGGATARAAVAARNKWQALEQKAGTSSSAPVTAVSNIRVAPLLQTDWSQACAFDDTEIACYNYYTPPYGAGNPDNYVCGCVATAMAQLMRYYQYPTTGVGMEAFEVTVSGSTETLNLRGGNGSGGAYDWSDMVTMVPGSANPTTIQCQAIGALTYDAGVAVSMEYASSGSGAYSSDAKIALTSVFKYSNAIFGGSDGSGDNIGTGLYGMVNPSLDAKYPVIFGIDDGVEGHEIVCDGYGYDASTLYHHLNLGWSGSCNAWYALPDIDAAGNNEDFTFIDSCIYNVYRSGTGEIISGLVTNSSGLPITNAIITATVSGGASYTANTDTNGIFALDKVPSATQFTVAVTASGYASASQTCVTGTSEDDTNTSGNVWGVNFGLGTGQTISITTTSSPVAGGTTTGGGTYACGCSVTVTATANSGYTFSNWTLNGSVLSTSASYTFTAMTSESLVANFTPVTQTCTISIISSPPAGGTTTGGGTYACGCSVTVTATANSGYTFSNWTLNGSVLSTSASYTFTAMTSESLVANFVAAPVTTNALDFAIGNVTGNLGTQVVVLVTVQNFSNLVSFQFSVHWDALVASFVDVEQFGISSLPGSFATNLVGNGTMTVAWTDPTLVGVTLTNGTTVFVLRFNLVGASGSQSSLYINGTPTGIDAFDSQFNTISIGSTAGQINVTSNVQLAGTITYYNSGVPVPDVTLNISGTDNQMLTSATDGTYAATLTGWATDTVTPFKTTDSPASEGVSTLDILLIRRHILAIAPLNSPYEMIAADITRSQSISTLDILLIRQLILGLTNSFPGGLWNFVPADYVFANPANPWPFPDSYSYTNITSNMAAQNFVGIKLGDVCGAWMSGDSTDGVGRETATSTPQVTFQVPNQTVPPGGTLTVLVDASGFTNVSTLQFSVQWDASALQFQSLGDFGLCGMNCGNFNTNTVSAGQLSVSWDDPNGELNTTLPDGSTIFAITFSDIGANGSSSIISFGDTPTVRQVTANLQPAAMLTRSGLVSVTSHPAPLIFPPVLDGNNFTLTWTALAGRSYELQYSADLISNSWVVVTSGLKATQGCVSSTLPKRGDKGFYRVVMMP